MIKIINAKDCCGCTACASVCARNAIKMKPDNQGFVYPQVDMSKCVDCGLCEKTCPNINFEKRNKDYKNIYAFRTKDDDVLMRSSSGGAFFSVASIVIEKMKGVVFGVAYDENTVVRHTFAEDIEGLKQFHGSKYVQSDITGIFQKVKSFLMAGRFVLFTGTPCQVMALRLFLRKTYDNLLTIDIICHSVPSPLIFKEYVEYVSKNHKSRLLAINMRSKLRGWSHAFYYYYYYFADGHAIGDDKLKAEHWGKLFFSGLITRPSCNDCKFTSYRRSGDITIADYWDDEGKRKEAYSTKGTSLFIVSTEQGEKFKQMIEKTSYFWKLSEEEAFQPCLKSPVKANPNRELFWEYYNKKGFEAAYNKFFKTKLRTKVKRRIKKVLVGLHLFNMVKKIKK